MWDERYQTSDYVYGTSANDFLKENINCIPKGNVLSLAEGEGRNAVYLATQGYDVTAVDSSLVGLEKAQKLARLNGVSITCIHADLSDFEIEENAWQAIISIFCPLPSDVRTLVYEKVARGLCVGGVFLTESYTPEQLKYGTGGGSCADTMQTKTTLATELPSLQFSTLVEREREVLEGIYHTGLASVVQAIGHKI